MYPIKQTQGVVILTYFVALVQSHCTRGTKNQLTNVKEWYIHEYGPNRPVIINYGPHPPKEVLSTTSIADVNTPMYQTITNQNQPMEFQVIVGYKNNIGKTQTASPVPPPTPLQRIKPNSISFGTLVAQEENTSPGTGITTGISRMEITDNSVANEKTIETAASLDSDKGFGHSSILSYNVGSFQGLKIVSNYKISKEINGAKNSPGSNVADFTVNFGNRRNASLLDGTKGPQ